MSQEPYSGDRPGDPHRDEERAEGGGDPPAGDGASSPEPWFTPTDLSRLFEGSAAEPSDLRGSKTPSDDPIWSRDRASELENITPKKLYEKVVRVIAVYEQTAINGQRAYFVQIRDDAEREIKIFVGSPEATAITMAAEGYQFKRPLTHDLTKTIIERMGWKIERILIDDLYNETFYAKLTLARGDEVIDIDCRPSDAIALGMRARAPIYVAEEVLKAASRDSATPEEGDTSE